MLSDFTEGGEIKEMKGESDISLYETRNPA
jgi:hypothetical protein